MEMHILSFHKATSSLFHSIIYNNLDAIPSLSKDRSITVYPATSCIIHPLPTRLALLPITHVWNLDHCLHVYDGSSPNPHKKQVVKHLVENLRLHSIAAFLADRPCLTIPPRHKGLRRRPNHDRQPRRHLHQSVAISRPPSPSSARI